MKLVFASLPAFGHLYPMMPLALACADAGHEVVVATGEPFLGRLPVPTVRGVPAGLDLAGVLHETQRRHPGATRAEMGVLLFADVTAGAVAPVLLEVLEEHRPDLLVYEALDIGAGIATDLLDVPAAAFGIGLDHSHLGVLHAAAVDHQHARWPRLAGPRRTTLLAQALLDPVPPSLAVPADLRGAARLPVRTVGFSESIGVVPEWLTEPRSRPRVYITLGTVFAEAVEVLRRATAETSALAVDVLVAVGPDGDPAALGAVPPNVRVERFVPQSQVMGLVDLVVHHGGTGTVLGALAAGLPQLLLPQGADQFHNARALSVVGAAESLLGEDQRSGGIGRTAAALLADESVRAAAARLRDEIAAMPAPPEVVPRLVDLAR